jgi:Flp pilus assembly protein TadG
VRENDSGAAIADFALVAGLLTLLFLGVMQLALVLHVRNTLVDCASEGARYGALADRSPAEGAARARDLIESALAPAYAADVVAGHADVAGVRTVEVTVRAPIPVVGLLGPRGTIVVSGHGVEESR